MPAAFADIGGQEYLRDADDVKVTRLVRREPDANRGGRGVGAYQGIVRLVNARPISAARWPPAPIITPSLIMPTTSSGVTVFRKKILLALVAASTFARAACIAGGSGPGPFLTPSENAMSPGPHSAKATPGTRAFTSALSSAYLSSSFRPSSSSPFGLSG